jgi:hypothetical protein
MLFLNKRQYTSSSSNNNTNTLVFINKHIRPPPPKPVVENTITTATDTATEETLKRFNWGKPTWYLFHTLAEKVKEDAFPLIKHELFNIIKIICINLPCPICATHAKNYIENIQIYSITNKEQFKDMLFQFHNTVNVRKNYPEFPKDQLSIYSSANLENITKYFMMSFKDKSRNVRMISNEMFRNMVLTQVSKWLAKYANYF